jgi:hypothetical protein
MLTYNIKTGLKGTGCEIMDSSQLTQLRMGPYEHVNEPMGPVKGRELELMNE